MDTKECQLAGLAFLQRLRDFLKDSDVPTAQRERIVTAARGSAGGLARGEKLRETLADMKPPDFTRLSDAQLRATHSRIHRGSVATQVHKYCVGEMGRREMRFRCEGEG